MGDDYPDIDGIDDRLSLDNPGPGVYEVLMRALTKVVDLVKDDLPPVGRTALEAARRYWLEGHPDEPLEDHRVACWAHLDAKNGDSTTIADREDHAVRAVICVLDDSHDNHLYEVASFAFDMMSALGVPGSVIDSIFDQS